LTEKLTSPNFAGDANKERRKILRGFYGLDRISQIEAEEIYLKEYQSVLAIRKKEIADETPTIARQFFDDYLRKLEEEKQIEEAEQVEHARRQLVRQDSDSQDFEEFGVKGDDLMRRVAPRVSASSSPSVFNHANPLARHRRSVGSGGGSGVDTVDIGDADSKFDEDD